MQDCEFVSNAHYGTHSVVHVRPRIVMLPKCCASSCGLLLNSATLENKQASSLYRDVKAQGLDLDPLLTLLK